MVPYCELLGILETFMQCHKKKKLMKIEQRDMQHVDNFYCGNSVNLVKVTSVLFWAVTYHFARSIRVSQIPVILLKNKTRQLKMKMRFSYVYDEVFNTKTGFRQITTTLATLKYFCEVMLLCLNHLYHFFSKKGLPHPPKWSPVAF